LDANIGRAHMKCLYPAMRALIVLQFSIFPSYAQSPPDEPMIVIPADQTRLYRLPTPAAKIIVGNPTIVDATLIYKNLLALTGKTSGVSNIIVRDRHGAVVVDWRVSTRSARHGVIKLFAGAQLKSLACAPGCEAMVHVGDAPYYYDKISKQAKAAISNNPCDSPNQTDSAGKRCGKRSAFSRAGGRPGFE